MGVLILWSEARECEGANLGKGTWEEGIKHIPKPANTSPSAFCNRVLFMLYILPNSPISRSITQLFKEASRSSKISVSIALHASPTEKDWMEWSDDEIQCRPTFQISPTSRATTFNSAHPQMTLRSHRQPPSCRSPFPLLSPLPSANLHSKPKPSNQPTAAAVVTKQTQIPPHCTSTRKRGFPCASTYRAF